MIENKGLLYFVYIIRMDQIDLQIRLAQINSSVSIFPFPPLRSRTPIKNAARRSGGAL